MTAPDLEGIIAAALNEHWRAHVDIAGDDIRYVCECGAVELVEGSGHSSTTTWSRAHQARAVLAAIREAGNAETVTGFGVKLKGGDVERCGTNIACAKEDLADMAGWHDDYYNPVEVVTRTTTTITIRTDWTAVRS